LDYLVAESGKEATNFAVATLGQLQLDGAVTVVGADQVGTLSLEEFAFVLHAFREAFELALVNAALDHCQILLSDTVPGVGEVKAELSIIGEEEQAFAVLI
jgi:uncharacterized membrane protein